MPVNVTGPDGKPYSFPDGTTKEKAVAYFKKKGIGVKAAAAPTPASFYERLTAGYDPKAAEFDERHPVLGKPVRLLSAVGGAVLATPGAVYHSFADPATEEEKQQYAEFEQAHGEAPGTETSGVKRFGLGVKRMMVDPVVQAGRSYASGEVTPGGAMSVLPEAIGTGIGTEAAGEMTAKVVKGTKEGMTPAKLKERVRQTMQRATGVSTQDMAPIVRETAEKAAQDLEKHREAKRTTIKDNLEKQRQARYDIQREKITAREEAAKKTQEQTVEHQKKVEKAKAEAADKNAQNRQKYEAEKQEAERSRAAGVAIEDSREGLQTQIQEHTEELDRKISEAEKTAKTQDDEAWGQVRAKTEGATADVTNLQQVAEQAAKEADPATSAIFRSILREGGEEAKPVHVDGQKIGPENPHYEEIYEQLYGEPAPLEPTTGFDRLHRWYTYLTDKMYNGGWKEAGTYNALKKVRDAVDSAMRGIAKEKGATQDLGKARDLHTRRMEAFHDSPNERQTAATKTLSETNPEYAKAKARQTRIAKVAHYDPSITETSRRIDDLRERHGKLPAEGTARNLVKDMPEEPKPVEPNIPEAPKPVEPNVKDVHKLPVDKEVPKPPKTREVDLPAERKRILSEKARTWGMTGYDAAILGSSLMGGLFTKLLGEAGSVFRKGAIAYVGSKVMMKSMIENPKFVEWVSKTPPGEVEVLKKIPNADKIKIIDGITEAVVEAKQQGKFGKFAGKARDAVSAGISPALADFLGAENVARIMQAGAVQKGGPTIPKTAGEAKKRVNDLRASTQQH